MLHEHLQIMCTLQLLGTEFRICQLDPVVDMFSSIFLQIFWYQLSVTKRHSLTFLKKSLFIYLFIFNIFIGVYLLYNGVLVSAVYQSESAIHLHTSPYLLPPPLHLPPTLHIPPL